MEPTEPGEISRNSLTSLPLTGRLLTWAESSVVPDMLEEVSTVVVVPVTSTDSLAAATARTRLIRTVAPTFNTKGWVVALPKLAAVAETT